MKSSFALGAVLVPVFAIVSGATAEAAETPPAPTTPNPTEPATKPVPTGPRSESDSQPRGPSLIAPQIVSLRPTPRDGVIRVDVHKRFELLVETTDSLGESVELEIYGRPENSSYDPALHYLTWQPSQSGVEIPLRIVAKAGQRYSERTVVVEVVDGVAPRMDAQRIELASDGGGPPRRVQVFSSDAQPLHFSAKNLPTGLQLNPETGEFFTAGQLAPGSYPIEVTVQNETGSSHATVTVVVIDPRRNDTESYFLPGAGVAFQATGDGSSLGTLVGPAIEILAAAWVHDNENRGPSHGRIYVRSELLKPSGTSSSLGLTYSLGFDLSLERNPARRFLIPHYGLDFGGIVQKELGHEFQTTPYLGVHLVSTENLFIQARAGYRLVPSKLDQFSGFHAGLTLDYSVW